MKVIFLDIDGVLCTLRSHYAFGRGLLMQAWDITCAHMIKRLCKEHDLKIVVSSTWRLGRAHDCQVQMMVYGLWDYTLEDWRTPVCESRIRGDEIAEWLSKHPEVESYIILDDDSDFHEDQRQWHVQTDSKEGFSAQDYQKVETLLAVRP